MCSKSRKFRIVLGTVLAERLGVTVGDNVISDDYGRQCYASGNDSQDAALSGCWIVLCGYVRV